MRILLTGSTGYLGRQVLQRLIARGDEVRVLVRPASRQRAAPGGVEIISGDLEDPAAVERAVRGVEIVCHLALIYGPWKRFGLREFQVNTETTATLLHAAVKHGITRFVFSSSVMAYGWSHPAATWPLREDAPLTASFPYGLAKIRSEETVLRVCRSHRVGYAILRFCPIYGPDVLRYQQFFHTLLSKPVHSSNLFRVLSPGLEHTGVSHWIHIRDAAEAVLRAISQPRVSGVFNVAGTNAVTRWELISLIHAAAPPHRSNLAIYDTQRAQRELRFLPVVDIDSGVAEVLNSLRERPFEAPAREGLQV